MLFRSEEVMIYFNLFGVMIGTVMFMIVYINTFILPSLNSKWFNIGYIGLGLYNIIWNSYEIISKVPA